MEIVWRLCGGHVEGAYGQYLDTLHDRAVPGDQAMRMASVRTSPASIEVIFLGDY